MKKICSLFLAFVLFCSLFTFSSCAAEIPLDRYDIVASYNPDSATLTATETVSVFNRTENELSVLEFNLFPNAYREGAKYEPVSSVYHAAAYWSGESYGDITIVGVQNCERFEVGGADGNVLFVYLTESLFPDEQAEIIISFTVSLAKVNHRLGVTEKVVNLCNFYPVLCVNEEGAGYYECIYYSDGDPFYSECADYSVTFTVPTGYTVLASALGKGVEKNGKTTYSYNLSRARDFALCVAKDVKVLSAKQDGVEVNYMYYDDADAEKTIQTACLALDYFSNEFGKYGYDSFSLVQTGFCYGGMEYPGLVLLSDKLEQENYLYTVVHETAHQWWYAMVGNNQCEYAWLDEGLAEYSTVLFYERYAQYGKSGKQLVDEAMAGYKAYYGVYNGLFGEIDTSMSRNLGTFISEYEYVNLTYNKGVLLFDALRSGVGDARFFGGLKEYFTEYKYKIAKPEYLIDCMKKMGVDVEGLFESFTSGSSVI